MGTSGEGTARGVELDQGPVNILSHRSLLSGAVHLASTLELLDENRRCPATAVADGRTAELAGLELVGERRRNARSRRAGQRTVRLT